MTEGDVKDIPELVRSLTEKLTSNQYDCVVCTESITMRDRLWTCSTCFGVFHLPCIVYWSKAQLERQRDEAAARGGGASSTLVVTTETFRCPLCQAANPHSTTKEYRCYCGRVVNPKADAAVVIGSCGQQCGKPRSDPNCSHSCTLQCHPGPCPPCSLTRPQGCYCGANEKTVGCSSNILGFPCGEQCGKELSCGRHYCEELCHEGPCKPCRAVTSVPCHCGATHQDRACALDMSYSCKKKCLKKRDCGIHTCELPCHSGDCNICLRLPDRVSKCPCGQTPLWKVYYETPSLAPRSSCEDPIPVCGSICSQPLGCGMHFCTALCHDTDTCRPCGEMMTFPCACGASSKKYPCFVQYIPSSDWKQSAEAIGINPKTLPSQFPIRCTKKCKKPLNCGRHVCEDICCENDGHQCYAVCKRKAPCGIHECGQLCHKGMCPPCLNSSFERLYCRCRRSYVEPPVPCGTPPPQCAHPCIVPRPCGHDANHACHPDNNCPNCVVLVEKYCSSHHKKLEYAHPCYLTHVSCGKVCERVLTCCNTRCDKICHAGECVHQCPHTFPALGEETGGQKKKGKK